MSGHRDGEEDIPLLHAGPGTRRGSPHPRASSVDVTLTNGRKTGKVISNDFEGLQEERARKAQRRSRDSSSGWGRFVSFFPKRRGGKKKCPKMEIKYICSVYTGSFLCSPGGGVPRGGKTHLNDPFLPADRGQARRAPRGSGAAVTATHGGWAARGDAGKAAGAAGSTGVG